MTTESDESRPRSKKYMYFLVTYMGLIALVDNYLSLIETEATTSISTFFGYPDDTFILYWIGIFGFVAFLVFIIGGLADLWGRKIGMLILLILMGGSALLIGLVGTKSVWIFLTFYSLVILGTNVNLWTIPISEESIPKRRAFNGSIAFLIGLIPLYALFGDDIDQALGWQWMYGLMGAVGLALIIPWFFMKETKRWETNREEYKLKTKRNQFKEAIKKFTKRDWFFIILTGGIYICWNTSFKMATFTIERFYIDAKPIGDLFQTILIFAGLATIIGALSIGLIMEKFGRMIGFAFSSVGAALSYLGLAFHGHPTFMVLTYYFMACFLGFLLVYIPEMFSTEIRGTATGLSLTLSRVGYVIGPLIASAILSAIAIPTQSYKILYLVAGLIALVPVITLVFNKYEPKGKSLELIQEEVK